MSLVKKALKEAEAARRKKDAPFTGPQLMTVDFPPRAGYSNFALTALIAVTMLLSGVMMWKWFRADNHDIKVRARSYDAAPGPAAAPQTPTVQPQPASTLVAPAVKETTIKPEPAKPVDSAPTVIVASSLPTPPKPPTFNYKLQGITYVPGHSSAVINGKTVMAGERVDGAVIIKVDKDSVTLVNPRGETNLLEVP